MKILFVIFSMIFLLSCSKYSKDLSQALKSHENDEGIEEISALIKDKNFDRALYNSALLGYSDIVSGLVKSGADINNRGVDGSTPLILVCREQNIDAAKILIDNGADMSISDDNDKKAFDYISDKKEIIALVSVMSKKENMEVFNKFKDFSLEADDINMLLENVNKKVIDEMNNMLKKEYKDKEAAKVKSEYEFNTLIEKADTRNFNFGEKKEYTDNIMKVGDNFYYIFSAGVPIDRGGQMEYLDSYTSIWLIKGPLSIAQFGNVSASFVGGFNGLPLSSDINIVSKGDYFTLEDYAHFEKRKYTFKYYTFKAEDGIFYLNQISLLDNNDKTSTIYKYDSKDNSRMTIDDISYSFADALIGANYYGE